MYFLNLVLISSMGVYDFFVQKTDGFDLQKNLLHNFTIHQTETCTVVTQVLIKDYITKSQLTNTLLMPCDNN